jgi:hypothetical protein
MDPPGEWCVEVAMHHRTLNRSPALVALLVVCTCAATSLTPSAARAGERPLSDYPWSWGADEAATPVALEDRFPAPQGTRRIPLAAGGFSAWLRRLPLHRDRRTVRAHDGRPLVRPAVAVSTLEVGPRDLQQCADSAIRLHAEFLWSIGRAHEAAYHFTSGDRSRYADWLKGERFRVRGATVQRRRVRPARSGRAVWRAWLSHTFMYAGSASLRHDTDAVAPRAPLAPGDVFVAPGFPGHVVMILDIVESAGGARLALVGQGFMPAEDFHVVGAPWARDGVWFQLPEAGGTLVTPSWRPFRRAEARRFRGVEAPRTAATRPPPTGRAR